MIISLSLTTDLIRRLNLGDGPWIGGTTLSQTDTDLGRVDPRGRGGRFVRTRRVEARGARVT